LSGEVNGQFGTATLIGANVMTARSFVLGDGDGGEGTRARSP
jgi:hypothetical protein